MEAKRLEGKTIAAEIQNKIEGKIREILARSGSRPGLVSIQTSEDPSAAWYVGQQEKLAAKLGIDFQKISSQDVSAEKVLIKKVQSLSADPKVHGIFISMPLPKGFDADKVLLAMDSRKDVEGIHPASLGLMMLRKGKLIPPTAYAAFSLVKSTEIMLHGKKAAIIGQSAIVGRPLQLLLGESRVTTLMCNTGTSGEDIKKLVGMADIVIGCAGKPKMIKGEWIKKGAVVIDVGTTEVEGKLVGDIEFEAASRKAAFITPVPGGVGPLTVTMLMENLMTAYEWQSPAL